MDGSVGHERHQANGGTPVNAKQRAAIRRLVDEYLPRFEAGETPTTKQGGYFRRFLEQVERDELIDYDYTLRLEHLGSWPALKDLDLIGRADLADVRALLTAGIRSEYLGSLAADGSVWAIYVEAGTFTALLRRLDELEGEG